MEGEGYPNYRPTCSVAKCLLLELLGREQVGTTWLRSWRENRGVSPTTSKFFFSLVSSTLVVKELFFYKCLFREKLQNLTLRAMPLDNLKKYQ